jgi:hypothetical protein
MPGRSEVNYNKYKKFELKVTSLLLGYNIIVYVYDFSIVMKYLQ